MTTSCHTWWRNCALEADPEIRAIDQMEDEIAPTAPEISRIRELISCLELCHHKADRWVRNIVEAIAAGQTIKGLGTRSPGQQHPNETVWQNACAALAAWVAGCPGPSVDITVDTIPASQLLAGLGQRSPLKEWQVQRVIDKIRSAIHWPECCNDRTAQYVWLLIGGDEYELAYRTHCPEHYREHDEFWLTTVQTMIHDTENGNHADLSLGLAIDMLWPCHWRFVDNLQIVLEAIGGKLNPDTPFAACGRNISLLPIRRRMVTISNTLNVFCGARESNHDVDQDLLTLLGEPTKVKKWLATSLAKTILLQVSPPAKLREMSALTGPDWLTQKSAG